MITDGIRSLVQRDWARVRASKDQYWGETSAFRLSSDVPIEPAAREVLIALASVRAGELPEPRVVSTCRALFGDQLPDVESADAELVDLDEPEAGASDREAADDQTAEGEGAYSDRSDGKGADGEAANPLSFDGLGADRLCADGSRADR